MPEQMNGTAPATPGDAADSAGRRAAAAVTKALHTVLGLDDVPPTTRLSDIGRDSLLTVRLLALCRESLGVELPLRLLVTSATVGEFTAAVTRFCRDGSDPGADPAPAEPVEPVELVMSSAQKALYSLYAWRPALPAYNVPMVLRMSGRLDHARFRAAVAALAHRHDALRSSFVLGPNGPAVQVAEEPAWLMDEIDVAAANPVNGEVRGLALARDFAAQPLDLGRAAAGGRLIRIHDRMHLFVLVVHHIVCDGWSLRLLVRDLTHLYRDGDATGLPRLTDRALAAPDPGRERADALAGYWRERLAGAPELLQLPIDRPRPSVRDFAGARLPMRLSRAQSRRLDEFSAGHGTTVFTALSLVLALLLRRYTSSDDVVFSFPAARRHRTQTHELVGYLINMVPLRVRMAGNPTVAELMAQLHVDIADAYEHADLALEDILAASAAGRDPGFVPFAQVALVLLPGNDNIANPLDMDIERIDVATGTAKFDLSWYFEETVDGLTGYVEYATGLFDADTVAQLERHFRAHLDQLTTADLRILDVPLFAPEERTAIIDGGPGPADWEPVHKMFERRAAACPEAPALWFDGGQITYGWLNHAANRLAHELLRRGAGPERLVGICLERSTDQVVAVLGVLKAGAAYLPLDPAYPADRLGYLVADSRAGIVLTASRHRERLTNLPDTLDVLDLDAVESDSNVGALGDPGGRVAADQLAYVIYTSGTTGRPKGAELTHRGLANVIQSSIEDFELGDRTRVLQFVSFGFDASVWEMFMGLASGATLCLAPADPARSEQSIDQVIRKCQATLVYLPPALLATIDPTTVPNVRVVITGGDRIPAELRNRWAARARFFAAYGPTEGTIVQTWQECGAASVEVPPIGLPFPNVRLYLLDRNLDPVPDGVVGEVCIGGVAVGRGYRGRPGPTARSFLPDPYAPAPGGRLYRTGDLVRRARDGRLMFVGRADQQVKIRGYRIELGEVEANLRAQRGVAQAAVLAEPGGTGLPRLIGYVVPAVFPQRPEFARTVRDGLRSALPEHMVPSVVHVMSEFPLTVNGKVDRMALPALADVGVETLEALLATVERLSDRDARELLAPPGPDGEGHRT